MKSGSGYLDLGLVVCVIGNDTLIGIEQGDGESAGSLAKLKTRCLTKYLWTGLGTLPMSLAHHGHSECN